MKTSNRPHLALVTDAWSPQVNGVVTTLSNLVRLVRASGIDVTVVEPSMFRSIRLPGYAEVRMAAAPVAVYKTMGALRPDYVHIATEGPLGATARFWCRRRSFPFTTSYHTQFDQYAKRVYGIPPAPVTAYMRWFHGAAEKTLVPTPSVARELESTGFQNLVVWSRGVDSALYHPSARDADWYDTGNPDARVLLYVGRVSKEKSVEDFCRLAQSPDYSCWVVGDGPHRRELAERYGDRVRFVGYKYGEELARFYASADVMVFPSRTDTFGNVMTESMATGTPIAAYPVTGPIDVVADGYSGALEEDLAAAVERALACDRDQVREYATRFSWESCAQTFIDSLARPDTDKA